jgi:hypothetical protein
VDDRVPEYGLASDAQHVALYELLCELVSDLDEAHEDGASTLTPFVPASEAPHVGGGSGKRELWRLTLGRLRSSGVCAEPWGRDAAGVRVVLWELHMLGERPTSDQIREAGGVDGQPTGWSRAVAGLWSQRLAYPTRRSRGRHWNTTFVIPDAVIQEHDLEPIETRLSRRLSEVAADYAAALRDDALAATLVQLDEQLRIQALALRSWGQTELALRSTVADDVMGLGYRLTEPQPPIFVRLRP